MTKPTKRDVINFCKGYLAALQDGQNRFRFSEDQKKFAETMIKDLEHNEITPLEAWQIMTQEEDSETLEELSPMLD